MLSSSMDSPSTDTEPVTTVLCGQLIGAVYNTNSKRACPQTCNENAHN